MKPPKISNEEYEIQVRTWIMCGKVPFDTEEKAQRRAAELGYRAYTCPHCAKWHLTKKRK